VPDSQAPNRRFGGTYESIGPSLREDDEPQAQPGSAWKRARFPFLDPEQYSHQLGLDIDDALRTHGFTRPWIVVKGSNEAVWFVAERFDSEQKFDRLYVRVTPEGNVTASITPYQFYASDWAILGKLLVGDTYRLEAESIAGEITQKLNDNAK
jgi:hypothetical protein